MLAGRRRRASLALLIAGVPAVVAVLLIGQRSTADQAEPPADTTVPGAASMIARIDPETGQLVVGAGSMPLTLDAATRQALSRSSEGLVPVAHPDGSVSIDLQGRFQSVSVAHIGAEGRVITCVDDAQQAEAATMATPAPKAEVQ